MQKILFISCFLTNLLSFSATHVVTSNKTVGVGTIADKIALSVNGDTIRFELSLDTINDPTAWGIPAVVIDKNLTFIGNPTVIRTPMSQLIFDIKDVKVNFQNITFIGVPEWGPKSSVNSTGELYINNCTFKNAKLTSTGSTTINNCSWIVNGNMKLTTNILTISGNLSVIKNSSFNSTIAISGIIISSSNYYFEDCYFEGFTGHSLHGGAIATGGSGKINNCTFNNNHNTNKGGALGVNSGSIILSNCTFYNNSSSSHGGAIMNSANLEVNHCTFGYNTANTYGGGIYNGGDLAVSNSLFAKNEGKALGNDIFNYVLNGQAKYKSFMSNYTIYSDTINCFFNFKHEDFSTIIIDSTLYITDGLDELTSQGVLMFEEGSSPNNSGILLSSFDIDQKGNLRDSNPDLGAWESQMTLGYIHFDKETNIIAYPNPTSQILHISKFIDIGYLYDQFGNLIMKVSKTDRINIEKLPNGVYILKSYLHGLSSSHVIQKTH